MKIAVDCHIPFIDGLFEPFGIEVSYDEILNPAGADALIIRTRTRCDRAFLKDHAPKIIATATIGFDHIDTEYCSERGIAVATSAGCNAEAVADWVFSALIAMGVKTPTATTIGIVGVGNVGSIVDRVARECGFKTMLCDPPRRSQNPEGFVDLEELLAKSDIVTMHVPLNAETREMASANFFAQMRPDAMFLNASRGEIVVESALLSSQIQIIGLDVWCNEPSIDNALLKRADIATPHIAGYSLQGKAMASAMAVRNVARALNIDQLKEWYPPQVPVNERLPKVTWDEVNAKLPLIYDIGVDDLALRSSPSTFEKQRQSYKFRPQFF